MREDGNKINSGSNCSLQSLINLAIDKISSIETAIKFNNGASSPIGMSKTAKNAAGKTRNVNIGKAARLANIPSGEIC